MNIQKIINEANHAINALTNDKKATIASVRAYWVSYVESEQPALYIPAKLRTKAQIIARLRDLINWLNSFGRVNPYACGNVDDMTEAHEAALAEDFTRLIEAQRAAGLPVDEEGNDMREWCGNDIEAAHEEALKENDRFQWLANRFAMFWGGCDDAAREEILEVARQQARIYIEPIRIEQESNDKEFKRNGVHCFTDCGYDCKESVRLAIIEHYTKIAAENGLAAEGWHLQVWHNGGWHAVFKHDASGFMLSDNSIYSGINELRTERHNPARRWSCYNYNAPAGTSQIWVYAATPWQAIGGAIREAQQRIAGYRGIIGALAPAFHAHAKAADLYGATPANGYEVKA